MTDRNIPADPKLPEEPVLVSAGRYDEPLWMYKDEVGTHSEMGRKYERDRADFWHAQYEALLREHNRAYEAWAVRETKG